MQTSIEPIRRPLDHMGSLKTDQTRSRNARRSTMNRDRARALKLRTQRSQVARRFAAVVA